MDDGKRQRAEGTLIPEDTRELFELPEGVTYLNCAYMSPQLRTVREAGERAIAQRSRPWEITPPDFFTGTERVRALFAELIGGDSDGVAIVPAVSYGLATAAANLPVSRDEEILVLEEQFPSNVYVWRDLAAREGARLVTVPRPADHDWTAAVLDRLGDNTAIVAVPNCHWTDGSLVSLGRVGEAAREAGAALVVDATQSLGAYPLDVGGVRPDFLVASGYKWLLGPYSLGFMYAAPHRRDGRPLEHNWITRSGAEEFAGLTDYVEGYAPGARRYDVGERSNFTLMPMAEAALTQLLDWGVKEISARLAELTAEVSRMADSAGMESVPRERLAGHMTGVRLGSRRPPNLAADLAAEGVYASVRGESLRVSPHVYNTASDVERLFETLHGVLGRAIRR